MVLAERPMIESSTATIDYIGYRTGKNRDKSAEAAEYGAPSR